MECILLLSSILLPTTSALLIGKGVVFPNNPYVYIGQLLNLTCNLTMYDPWDHHLMYFTRQNQAIPQQYISILNRRSIRLQMPITSPRDENNYVCKLNKTNGELEIIGHQFVTVEYEPKRVENISCRVYNWEMMNCTWDLGVDYNHPENINVTLAWAIDEHCDCPYLTRTSCTWFHVDGPDSFKSDMTYHMQVSITDLKTMKKYSGSKTYTATTSILVEPASVKNVTISRNSSCISLQWKHERMERQLFYRVQFQSQWNKSDLWEVIDVGLSNSLTLCDLLPFTNYTFNITCIPYVPYHNINQTESTAGFWSKGKCFTVQTSEDVNTGLKTTFTSTAQIKEVLRREIRLPMGY